ncbi:hypothetical protein BX616_007715 [Lobosporangium transversale]|uniref:Uncharacterized protein n=1 Tax=Lobosporangium transversale TaxID=64571 RepID=A0A1Y2GJE8_9FUNG|nr:hypothetical protein BCR41DRAFT_355831 [Lobosporangium transversale]KAF9914710.1 hypothetical protein BX616_007715 [Lobosporangium transversale]ORZ12881.1 hypothetical protein BCR41DRAFT_355831 [Lobosporangium transversale]|eukprot:XP_021880230.1 hypothetical protein BCR41DRAFT_355831 [Lobosporangium transversale]
MRFTSAIVSVAALLALSSSVKAQDAACSAVLNDYAPTGSGAYSKCYTEQVYNAALVAQGGNPDYSDIIHQVCTKPACPRSTLLTATTKYLAACGSSIDAEASSSGGNILQLGKNALEVFFAAPIHEGYCAEDPNAPVPSPTVPPTPPPITYCLEAPVNNPASRFVSNLAIYLTSGSIRSSQAPFFLANNLDPKDVCSPCSRIAMTSTIDHLAKNKMPAIASFYTPEFVQYWTKLVPAYNTLCKTTYAQAWPEGTLNTTVPNVPTGTPSAPTTALPSAPVSASPTASPSNKPDSAAGSMKPAAGAAVAVVMAIAALL